MCMITEAVLTAITTGIVQVVKTAEVLPSRFLPVMSLVTGVVVVLINNPLNGESILQGLLVGLAASGLYSQVKTIRNG